MTSFVVVVAIILVGFLLESDAKQTSHEAAVFVVIIVSGSVVLFDTLV